MCLGVWSRMGYVRDEDVNAVAIMPDLDGEEDLLVPGWDSIS
jgi:hypothetical protein